MKSNELYDELLALAKKMGITVRRESGIFKSGYCKVNNQDVIVLNRSASPEAMSAILAGCLSRHKIDDIFIKPAVREYIEKESNSGVESDFNLEVKI
jgi:hypothetical protein